MKTEVIKLYAGRSDVTLTTYVLDDLPELKSGRKRPAIIICPGGAYMACSDSEGESVALRFAAMGYHAFVLKYSVYFRGEGFRGIPEHMEPKLECQYPTQMRELGMAMLILHENSELWRLDTEKIAICGFSAGAHNCGMYATNWHKPIIAGYLKAPIEKLRPAAMILSYMLSDYVFLKEISRGNPVAKVLFGASAIAFLGTESVGEELLYEVSPARNVSENTPPAFIWATTEDELVPVAHSLRMAHALADKAIPFEMHIFENGPHGLSLSTQASALVKMQIDPGVAKWIDLAEAWLMKRFALSVLEMMPFDI